MYERVYYKKDWALSGFAMEAIYKYLPDVFPDCDPALLIAMMTNREFADLSNMLLQAYKPTLEDFSNFGIMEIYPHIKGRDIDFSDPGL